MKITIGDTVWSDVEKFEILESQLKDFKEIIFEGQFGDCNHNTKTELDMKIKTIIIDDIEFNIESVYVCDICGDLIFAVYKEKDKLR